MAAPLSSQQQLLGAYAALGLAPGAGREDVKEAFRRLCWRWHPDKAAPEGRAVAEARFKEVKGAYEAILQAQAGYRPPPPGSPPTAAHATAYWHAHSADGRVPWGQYAGWETEGQFYRAMLRGGRNNMALLAVLGLLAIPTIAAGAAILQSFHAEHDAEEAAAAEAAGGGGGVAGDLDALRPDAFVVNGRVTSHNPWARSHSDAVGGGAMRAYQAAQARRRAAAAEAAAAAAGAAGASSGQQRPAKAS